MNWQADWGLRFRMFLTMFLLFALYIVFAGVITAYVGGGPLLFALLFGGLSLVQYYYSDTLTLRSMGATTVSADEYPQLHSSIERLSQQADLPKPKVAVIDSQVPNAFATGRNQKNAAVAVTTGLLNTLDREELDGVLAHELAHVKNRDMMVMTIASFLSTIAFMMVRWGAFFGGGRGRGGGRGGGGVVVAILVSLIVWIVSYLLIRALSRYREYAADRGAAAITGNPSALASALMKISGRMDDVPKDDMREEAEMNAFFIIPIKSGVVGRLFSTHPPTERRIEQLRELEHEMTV
ncbi:zinc metalloprotease HtpX [Natronobacterium gregoryi]|uniref:Protease HtpX homolog n=2 Tax=Natronobacterium gregoryi TaxID=44930 RepID=L0AFV7_NATGS|nr:zinc metalloprotease HtpX [Natronobacterium gregoryi]AFZ72691.1 Zn-dependent protease with chaperone function [Natronobacterium gregoryi SP2]ELY69016.1 heat shock protein HtpX [Natronobacterium gregoryi SP2]PLK20643.1 zinc metalloprotease HtpX [Natronobacterium gregoryi SP2]SFI91793.1 Heat shock protein. Metallo peptidase. MEROPS family M48B [Natronobacterium gregoryi]